MIITDQVQVDYETGFLHQNLLGMKPCITVMGPKGRWVEVQVRSERMDEIAEKGMQHITNTKMELPKKVA
jgi:hypothetical protein